LNIDGRGNNPLVKTRQGQARHPVAEAPERISDAPFSMISSMRRSARHEAPTVHPRPPGAINPIFKVVS
jgi:hypothetical protein